VCCKITSAQLFQSCPYTLSRLDKYKSILCHLDCSIPNRSYQWCLVEFLGVFFITGSITIYIFILYAQAYFVKESLDILKDQQMESKTMNSVQTFIIGGGCEEKQYQFPHKLLHQYVIDSSIDSSFVTEENELYILFDQCSLHSARQIAWTNPDYIICRIPATEIVRHLNYKQLVSYAKNHNINIPGHPQKSCLVETLIHHVCSVWCYDSLFLFKKQNKKEKKSQKKEKQEHKNEQ
jgi:hypothetical protein